MNIRSETLSVGFADLESFTKYVMKYGGKAAIELLNETYQLAGEIIVTHSGQIIKYMGDCLLFILNDPSQAEMVAQGIVKCFKKDFDDYTLRFCVAIATGEVFKATIGHSSLITDDIHGPTVNKAGKLLRKISSLEDNTKYLLCEETKKYIINL